MQSLINDNEVKEIVIPRFTKFKKPLHRSEGWHISTIYADIQNSEIRNEMIIGDILQAVEHGRSPLILSERTDHVKYLAGRLSGQIFNVISLMGGNTPKNSRELLQKVADIPASEPFVLVATGRYIGEGFDMPRLDTLFLAMPISWKGTVQQYVGRLHRLYEGKKEVQVYDYVDIHVPMLERMYQKRLKGYAGLGYKAKGEPMGVEIINSIYDGNNFFTVYANDITTAQNEVVIVSPFLSKHRISSILNIISETNAKVTVLTRPAANYPEKDQARVSHCLELLARGGIKVKTRENIHQKFAVIDQRLVWYGSINLLSFGKSEESIMRIESVGIADELLGGVHP